MWSGTETASLYSELALMVHQRRRRYATAAAVSWRMRRDTATGQRADPVLSLDARENKHVISPHDQPLSIGNDNAVRITQLTGIFLHFGV